MKCELPRSKPLNDHMTRFKGSRSCQRYLIDGDIDWYPELDLLSRALSFSSPALRVTTRIEAYSCKAIKSERRLFKTLEQDLISDLTISTSISPPEHHSLILQSPFGPLNEKESRKTLWLLISTLNLVYPDYDFSKVNVHDDFRKEADSKVVLNSLSSALNHLKSSTGGGVAGIDGSSAAGANPSATGGNLFRTFSSYPPTSGSLPNYSHASSNATSMSRQRSGSGSKGQAKQHRAGTSYTASTSTLTDRLRADLENHAGPSNYTPLTHPLLKQILDPIIGLNDCEVFSYTPDLDSDPHAYQSEDEEEEFDDAGQDDDSVNGGPVYRDDDDIDMELDYEQDSGVQYRNRFLSGMSAGVGHDEVGWEMDGIVDSVPNTPRSGFGRSNYLDTTSTGTPTTSTNPFSLDYTKRKHRSLGHKPRRRRQDMLSQRIGSFGNSGSHLQGPTAQGYNIKNSPKLFDNLSLPREITHPVPFGSLNSSYTSQSSVHSSNFSTSEVEDDMDDFEAAADETGGLLWSSNYFFYNKKMKRILFITCWGRKLGSTLPLLLNPAVERFTRSYHDSLDPHNRRFDGAPKSPNTIPSLKLPVEINETTTPPRPIKRRAPSAISVISSSSGVKSGSPASSTRTRGLRKKKSSRKVGF